MGCGFSKQKSSDALPSRPTHQSSDFSRSSRRHHGRRDDAPVRKEDISRVLESQSTTGLNYPDRPQGGTSIELQQMRPQPARTQDHRDPDAIENLPTSAPVPPGKIPRTGRPSSTPPGMHPANASERRINPERQARRQDTDPSAQTSTASSMPAAWQSGRADTVDQKSYTASSAQNKPPAKTRRDHARYQTFQGEGYPAYTPPRGPTYPPLTSTSIPASAPAPSFGQGAYSGEPSSYDQGPTLGVTTASAPGSGSSGKKKAARYQNPIDRGQERAEEAARVRDASDPSRLTAHLAAAALTPRSASDPSRLQAISTEQSSISTHSTRLGAGGHFALDDQVYDTDRRSRGG